MKLDSDFLKVQTYANKLFDSLPVISSFKVLDSFRPSQTRTSSVNCSTHVSVMGASSSRFSTSIR